LANTEDALIGLEQIINDSFPTYLRAIELENIDGVVLENIREITWEEIDESGSGLQIPGVMLLPNNETDESQRDIIYVCNITAVFLFQDSNKRNVTKKMFRYGKALRRMLKPTNNRSLRGKVISVKVVTIRWMPTGRGITGRSAGLFARGFEVDLVVRLPKEGD
jgi:hypothetical protein